MDDRENAIKIAVIEEQITGIREQQKAHADEMRSDIKELKIVMTEFAAVFNRGKGAYAASMALAGTLGAIILTVINNLSDWFHR